MSDRLTLVVFKDHLSSRTLTVRLTWLRALAFTLLSVIGLAILSGALFLNAYRKTTYAGSLGDSRRAAEAEKELAEVKASYESLKEQALSRAAGGTSALGGSANSFTSLPADAVLETLPAKETLPFRLEAIKASWRGSTLQIRSAIEYAREDGGNQQGHFILMVRGPQAIHAYPEGTFASAGTPSLMKPDAGEFFSVSRYREIKADFGPFARRDDVQNIEIYVFDTQKRLIYFDRVGIEQPGKTAPHVAPAPPTETAAPAKRSAPVAPKPEAADSDDSASAPSGDTAVPSPAKPADEAGGASE